MTRYAVVGASSGTGLAIVRHLAERHIPVRAISRRPPPAGGFIEPFAADVTEPSSIANALDGEFSAVFYTVDVHGLFKSRDDIRGVMFQGCVNTIQAAARSAVPPNFVLLSVIGPEQPSWVWWLLNRGKPGMQRNILDREEALKASGLPYVICRAPKLNDEVGGETPVAATLPQHKLDMKRGIPRADLARTLVLAAEHAPQRTTWDVFSNDAGPVPDWLRPTISTSVGIERICA